MASGYTNDYTIRDVEFFGGPYDGHVQTMAEPPTAFVCLEWCRLKPSWLQRIRAALTWRATSPTSVAIYELENSPDSWRYRYLGSRVQNAASDA